MRNGEYELIKPPPEYPGKRYRGRYAYEHRVNWWRKSGLNPDDFPDALIHHEHGLKRKNDAGLVLLGRGEHTALHKPAKPNKWVCLNCGINFTRKAGPKPKFCSRRCIGLYGYPRRARMQ